MPLSSPSERTCDPWSQVRRGPYARERTVRPAVETYEGEPRGVGILASSR